MNKIIILSMIASSAVFAGGYKIPEQSLNSMALGAANVAYTTQADATYYNPAGMAFMKDKQYLEADITLAHLISQKYTLAGPASGSSETENIIIPTLHYVANAMGDWRWGMSLTVPGGLTKRWESPFQKASAEEFTLKVMELNPTFSYKVNDTFALGGGIRLVYTEGVVKSDSANANAINPNIPSVARDMEGDAVVFGYNLAMLYKPTYDINMAITYRSNIDLTEDGKANLYLGKVGKQYDASVTVPLPAALNIAISKTWDDRFTLEFNYERTYWSTYEELDFEYGQTLGNGIMVSAFDIPKARQWKDTDTFRLGATLQVNDDLSIMLGFAIDETPVNPHNIGFELADSDAKVYSMGFRYKQSEALSWGAAFLYDSKESITLKRGAHHEQTSVLNSGGRFTEGGAFLATVGMAYEF